MERLEHFVIAPDNIFLMIQPYIEGYDLYNLPSTYRFSFNALLAIAIELFTQLCKLHQLGLVHSDVLNQNIMLQLNRESKDVEPHLFLIDFGASYLKSATFLGWFFQLRDTVNAWDIVYDLFQDHIVIQEKNNRLYSDFMNYTHLNTFHNSTLFCTRAKKAVQLLHTIKKINEENCYETPNCQPSKILKEKLAYWVSPTELSTFLKPNIGFFPQIKKMLPLNFSKKVYSNNMSPIKCPNP